MFVLSFLPSSDLFVFSGKLQVLQVLMAGRQKHFRSATATGSMSVPLDLWDGFVIWNGLFHLVRGRKQPTFIGLYNLYRTSSY